MSEFCIDQAQFPKNRVGLLDNGETMPQRFTNDLLCPTCRQLKWVEIHRNVPVAPAPGWDSAEDMIFWGERLPALKTCSHAFRTSRA